MADFNAPPKKKHALNHSKLVLSAPCPTAKGKYSQLKFDVYMNNPRMVVRTNDPSEMDASKGFGTINANMDTPTFYAFLELLKLAIASEKEDKWKISNYTAAYVDNKPTNEVTHVSDIWVGKDKENQVFVSIISKKEDRPIIKFVFGPSDARFHTVTHSNGTPWTKPELSVLFAKSYLTLLSEVMAGVLVSEYTEPAPRAPFNKGAGYSNNASYQRKETPRSESNGDMDIPF